MAAVARVFLTLIALLVARADASDYPTNTEDQDKLCEVIGEAPNLSVPPKDRLWFKDTCICAGDAGCGKLGSARFIRRLDAAKQVRERIEAEKVITKAAAEAKRKEAAAAAETRREETLERAALTAKRRLGRLTPKRAATQGERTAFWRCQNNEVDGNCYQLGEVLEAACRNSGLSIGDWTQPPDECYGSR